MGLTNAEVLCSLNVFLSHLDRKTLLMMRHCFCFCHCFQRDLGFALVCVGAVVGSLLFGALADRIGRRRAMILTILPFASGVFIMCYWLTLVGLSIGRIFCGIGVGAVSGMTPHRESIT
jgi:MFS family permease